MTKRARPVPRWPGSLPSEFHSTGEIHGSVLSDLSVAGAAVGGAHSACNVDCRYKADPMTIITRFGKKLKVPSTFQIKHQLLLFWLKDQLAKEAAEDKTRQEDKQGVPVTALADSIPHLSYVG